MTLTRYLTPITKFKKSFIAAFVVLFSLLGNQALAADKVYTAFLSNDAIKGYDTVAYHTENKAVKGSDDYSVEYMGATWLFASAENKALFEADKEKYAPQYGGYCAYAVAKGSTASIEPEQFSIVDGKLYLNYNESVKNTWRQDTAKYIESADKNWPGVLN